MLSFIFSSKLWQSRHTKDVPRLYSENTELNSLFSLQQTFLNARCDDLRYEDALRDAQLLLFLHAELGNLNAPGGVYARLQQRIENDAMALRQIPKTAQPLACLPQMVFCLPSGRRFWVPLSHVWRPEASL